jgi:anti-sigma B factor antagonist
MQIDVTDAGDGIAVAALNGRLNMASAGRLREAVNSAVAAGRTRIAVDLTSVEFMDSSGLGALVNGLKVARQAGGDLRIAAPSEQVRLVLQLTNMEKFLTTVPDANTAFAS